MKVSTSLGLLLAHLGFLGRPVDLLPQERYTTCSSLFPPKSVVYFIVCIHYTYTQRNIHLHLHPTWLGFLCSFGVNIFNTTCQLKPGSYLNISISIRLKQKAKQRNEVKAVK